MTDTTEIRAAFEADYFVGLPMTVPARERSGDGYKYSNVQFAWSMWQSAWQAARASQAAPLPVAELEAMRKDAERKGESNAE